MVGDRSEMLHGPKISYLFSLKVRLLEPATKRSVGYLSLFMVEVAPPPSHSARKDLPEWPGSALRTRAVFSLGIC